jgi:predicted transcriptional regulator
VRALCEGDIFALVQSGAISVDVTGDSIKFTNVRLTNKTSRNINVTVPIGAYFAASSGSVQNMVVRIPETVTIQANSSASASIATACMNIHRSIPNSNNGFSVSILENSKLARVMALLKQNNASYAITQAAVWIVTDNPSEYDLLNTLVYQNGGRAISSDDLAKAQEIVRAAG